MKLGQSKYLWFEKRLKLASIIYVVPPIMQIKKLVYILITVDVSAAKIYLTST